MFRPVAPLRCLIALSAILLLNGCRQQPPVRSFCFWQRSFTLSSEEWAAMRQTGTGHLYIRFFDVDVDEPSGKVIPVGTLIVKDAPPCSYTPAVFITNKVFERTPQTELDTLAKRIVQRIETIDHTLQAFIRNDTIRAHARQATGIKTDDILIDCDWTTSTRDRYFCFLQKVRQLMPRRQLSVTLRLWQYRHREQAGIPPANRCLLMCYNMTDPAKPQTGNSIGSTGELTQYLTGKNYPLKTDIALPLFGWGVLFHNGAWAGLLGNVNATVLHADTAHFAKESDNTFMVRKDTVAGNRYLRYGDRIRMEQIDGKELEKMSFLIKKRLSLSSGCRITLFALDPRYINLYGTEEINRIYSVFNP
jgi:hypothetical protein